MRLRLFALIFSVSICMALAGCATGPKGPMAGSCPVAPAPRVEVTPKPPVSEDPLVWQPGHWDWNGGGYTWRAGAWVARAANGTTWLDGYWTVANGQCIWVPAHWLN